MFHWELAYNKSSKGFGKQIKVCLKIYDEIIKQLVNYPLTSTYQKIIFNMEKDDFKFCLQMLFFTAHNFVSSFK